MPLVYGEFRALAGKYLRGERPGHTLQPTALVHEAYIRLIDISRMDWQGKTHFYAMAATQVRRILAVTWAHPDEVTLDWTTGRPGAAIRVLADDDDRDPSAAGDACCYLVRAANACATGPWEPGANRCTECP